MMIDPCEVCGKSTREMEDLRREVQEFKTSGRVNITALLAGLDAVKRTLQAGALTPTVVSMITVLTYRLIPPPTGTGELLGATYDDLVKERDALRAERDELAAEVARLKAAVEDADNRAFTRGLFWALATHADQCGQEEGIRTTDIRTVAQAIAAGVDEQDASTLKPRFAAVHSREADTKARREKRAATGAKS